MNTIYKKRKLGCLLSRQSFIHSLIVPVHSHSFNSLKWPGQSHSFFCLLLQALLAFRLDLVSLVARQLILYHLTVYLHILFPSLPPRRLELSFLQLPPVVLLVPMVQLWTRALRLPLIPRLLLLSLLSLSVLESLQLPLMDPP